MEYGEPFSKKFEYFFKEKYYFCFRKFQLNWIKFCEVSMEYQKKWSKVLGNCRKICSNPLSKTCHIAIIIGDLNSSFVLSKVFSQNFELRSPKLQHLWSQTYQ